MRKDQASLASSLLPVFKLQILLKDELENQNLEVFWMLLENEGTQSKHPLLEELQCPSACDKEPITSVAPARVWLLLPLIPPFHS